MNIKCFLASSFAQVPTFTTNSLEHGCRRLSSVWQARAPDFLLLTSFKDFFKRPKNFFKKIRRLVMNVTREKRNLIKTELFRGAVIPGSSFLFLNCNFNLFKKTVIPDFHNRESHLFIYLSMRFSLTFYVIFFPLKERSLFSQMPLYLPWFQILQVVRASARILSGT